MVELRKRKTPAEPAAPPPAKKANSVKSSASSQKGESSANGSATANKISLGDTINLDNFGGEIETDDGEKVTVKKLVAESKSGIVIFTYPKASTPGCKIPNRTMLADVNPRNLSGVFRPSPPRRSIPF